ncbi:Protein DETOXIFICATION [Melia azedarach]|uniref:Protein DETOXIFICATION n=1 Tax=Melia azedarach TaxID=155640 RepID=A0ACC1XUU2_MELAZ|nr:Protein DETOXIFICATION [Melia azedarach]
MVVITRALAGHLGDLELAAISVADNVILGFDFGLLLGMASALETLCGQASAAKKYFMLGVYMQRSWIVLLLKAGVLAWVGLIALVLHVIVSWLFVFQFKLGVIGTAVTLSLSWWILAVGLLAYTVCGGCPLTWTGFTIEAFSGLWDFVELSAASGVMLCLENWYYRVLILITGNLKNTEIALDAVSICMSVTGWQMMISLAFFAGNGRGAKFATTVGVATSSVIGFLFFVLILMFNKKIALFFSSSELVLEALDKLKLLLAFTILLNSVQPVLSGVPFGYLFGWSLNQGVVGIWAGMIFGGTAMQTLILRVIIIHSD